MYLVKGILFMPELPVQPGAKSVLREETHLLPPYKPANKAVGVTGNFCNLYMWQHTRFSALSTPAGSDCPDQAHPCSPAMLPSLIDPTAVFKLKPQS